MASHIIHSTARLLSRRSLPSASLSTRLAPRHCTPTRLPTVSLPRLTAPRRFYASEPSPALPQPPSSSSADTKTIDVSSTATKNPDGSTSYSASFPLPEQLKRGYELTFTCKVCQTRSTHNVSHQGYHKGTVLIACPGCKNRHLIADHLKIFTDKATTIEEILREKGEVIKKGIRTHDGDIEILPPEELEENAVQGEEESNGGAKN